MLCRLRVLQACKKGHVDVVEVLLKHGVDTRVQSNFDHTAAQFALRSQHFEIHNMLLEHEKRSDSTTEYLKYIVVFSCSILEFWS